LKELSAELSGEPSKELSHELSGELSFACRTSEADEIPRLAALPRNDRIARKARGLTEAVLQAIRTDVFNVVAPVGP
jgi:hypothetical protein